MKILKGSRMNILLAAALATLVSFSPGVATAASPKAERYRSAEVLQNRGNHLQSARYYFSVYTDDAAPNINDQALAGLTENLILAGYPNTASYFYIKTLQSGSRPGIRRILRHLPRMIDAVGTDVLKSYIIAHTSENDYDTETKNQFFYFVGKDKILKGETQAGLDALKKVNLSNQAIGAGAAQLRATAHAILGQSDQALEFFGKCESLAGRAPANVAFDIEMRCRAGRARTLYQMDKHREADDLYDEVSKKSFVWTDILFEQAWNSYALGDYNRALGKLVTYRSPALGFVFNPEVDVLRAQSFLSLCLYDDANKVINEFNNTYHDVGLRLKQLLTGSTQNFYSLYDLGKGALKEKLHTNDMVKKALNRFVRGPYFAGLVEMEAATFAEAASLRSQLGNGGFGQFLAQVAGWRVKSIKLLGGVFVRNGLLDQYNDLLADFDKMSFIKSEMLSRVKTRLARKGATSADEDGVNKRGKSSPDRKDYQFFWSFNGEFWNDELGDYVFALESECR